MDPNPTVLMSLWMAKELDCHREKQVVGSSKKDRRWNDASTSQGILKGTTS